MSWWKKIKERIHKYLEKVEKKDREFVKKHPKAWKGYTIFLILVFVAFASYGIINDIYFLFFAIPMGLIWFLMIRDMNKTYNKAMKELKDGN